MTKAMAALGDVRGVLQYVPQFRGRVFVVLIETGLLPESAVAEILLDLTALQDVGVKLVLGVLGGDLQDFYDWTLECEMKVARLPEHIFAAGAAAGAGEVLKRGQAVIVDCRGCKPFDPAVIAFAAAVGAAKLIAVLDEEVLVDGAPVPAVRAADVGALLQRGGIEGGALLLAAAAACHSGVPRVHLLNGRRQGVLVDELFSNEGVGTMVHADIYREIRPLSEEDIPELLGMIGRSVKRTRLVARSYEDIRERLQDYQVLTLDDNVVGCAALHVYPGEHRGEIACLYVKQSHETLGYGAQLVRHIEEHARQAGLDEVFALTTGAVEFFRDRLGYLEVPVETIPQQRLEQFRSSGRHSRVFVHKLHAGAPQQGAADSDPPQGAADSDPRQGAADSDPPVPERANGKRNPPFIVLPGQGDSEFASP
jgi:amino-acid N-acetyltransferase